MSYLMGIDLGTSSVKTLIVDLEGNTKGLAQQEYPIDIPAAGYAEQHPDTWWQATVATIRQALQQVDIEAADICGIGLSGQMHGMVLIDRHLQPVRPAIIWCDQRSFQEVAEINEQIGKEELGRLTLNPVATGFQTASVLWVRKNEPNHYQQTYKILLPKDYIRLKLTGEIGTDVTDASGTLAFDTANGNWSAMVLKRLGLDSDKYPDCGLPYEVAGSITAQAAAETGLKANTLVVFGGGDQPMQALGNGIFKPGWVSSNIGTGGQISALIDQPLYDQQLRTQTFCHALPQTWNIMGAMLAAGLSLKWLKDNVLGQRGYDLINDTSEKLPPASGGLLFLPYLTGERTPHMDPAARGVFCGLTLEHTSSHLARAVMEGVAFALRDSLNIFAALGVRMEQVIASGGGARSRLWLQIQADVFNKEVYTAQTVEQACLGAAIVAGVGAGVYSSIQDGCSRTVKVNEEPVKPNRQNVDVYDYYYPIFQELYTRNKDIFARLHQQQKR